MSSSSFFPSSFRWSTAAVALALSAASPALAAVDLPGAVSIFREARAICGRDAGALWGTTLCGPILLLDPVDRAIVANQADGDGVLKVDGSVFTGTLPPSEIVANTSVQWSGTLWTEMLWPLPDDAAKRRVMLAHEMFHRVQPALKMARLDGNNVHLDTLEGRVLLQLEWRALAKALRATTATGRKAAVVDALSFRRERYRLFAQASAEEGALESNEGIAEYTGVRLGLSTPDARVDYAIRDLSAFVDSPTFVRSFAYATGPAYGLLLDGADPGWRRKLESGQRLDQLLATALRLPESAFASIAARERKYDDGALRVRETQRDTERTARLTALKARFIDGAVLTLPLERASFQFNPQTLQPLGAFGTVYPTLRLTAVWGVLEVDDGALLDHTRKVAVVSAAGIDPSGLMGAGWRLTLNAGWTVQPGVRQGDLVVQQIQDGGH